MACRFVEPDGSIVEWDMSFEAPPSAGIPPLECLAGWQWPKEVIAPKNDGVEIFALPLRVTRALASAGFTELEALAGRRITRLRAADGDDMTDDDFLAVLQDVARLAASAVRTGGGLYSGSCRHARRP